MRPNLFLLQMSPEIFNKGSIMNAGFLEINSTFGHFDCFVFHDVDMMPEDDRNFYTCVSGSPIHLAQLIDKYQYKSA